jgi:hypothetical protein
VRGGSGPVTDMDGRPRGGWSVCPIGTGEGKHGARGGFSVGQGKKGEKGSGGGTTRWRTRREKRRGWGPARSRHAEENGAWPDRRAASGRHNPSAVATGGRRGMSGQGTTGEQGWRAWATLGEHGPAEEEGKWAGPERKQCWFKKYSNGLN